MVDGETIDIDNGINLTGLRRNKEDFLTSLRIAETIGRTLSWQENEEELLPEEQDELTADRKTVLLAILKNNREYNTLSDFS